MAGECGGQPCTELMHLYLVSVSGSLTPPPQRPISKVKAEGHQQLSWAVSNHSLPVRLSRGQCALWYSAIFQEVTS